MLTNDEKIRGVLIFLCISGFIMFGLCIISIYTKGVNLDVGSIGYSMGMALTGFISLIGLYRYKKYGIEGLRFGKHKFWKEYQ